MNYGLISLLVFEKKMVESADGDLKMVKELILTFGTILSSSDCLVNHINRVLNLRLILDRKGI